MSNNITNKYRVLFILSSAWMIGTGIRFLILTLGRTYKYEVSLLDKIFDWGILTLLGVILLIWTVYQYYKSKEKVF